MHASALYFHLVYLDKLQPAQGNHTTPYRLSRRLTTQCLGRTCVLMFKSGRYSAEYKSCPQTGARHVANWRGEASQCGLHLMCVCVTET
jgi:hypothetical protein